MASETETPADATEAPASGGDKGTARRRPGLKTARDMFLSMVVISAGAFGLFLFVPHDESQDPIQRPVEYRVASGTAARVAPYDVLIPEGLSDEWRASSVRYEPAGQFGATWRLGFVNPADEYAALAQADGSATGFIAEMTHQAEDTGSVERIDGRDWARYEGSKYDALVLRQPGVTTLVLGTAPFSSLAHLADALETRTPGTP